jgi:hypothetical protein
MRIIPTRPRRPDFPPELIAELDLIGLQELRRLRYMAGNPGECVAEIRLLRRSIGRRLLEDWIAWRDVDNAWREARLYRVTMIGTIAAAIAAVLAFVAVLQNWTG